MRLLTRAGAPALAVALVAVASPVLLAPAPATAATCGAGGGVSVVVDYNSLGGGVATGCVAGGGGDTASSLFTAAGHPLTRAQRQPGFVCRVDDVPADDPCVDAAPADAYWSLWWTDGKSGTWTYSSLGVDSLKVPEGGSVAFSWDDVEGSAPPSAAAPRVAASPSPSPSTGGGSSGSGGSGGSTSGTSPSPSGSPTATATATDDAAGSREGRRTLREVRRGQREGRLDRQRAEDRGDAATGAPSDEASATAEVTADPAPVSTDDGGLPVWVAPVALLVLAAGAGATALLRRRSAR